MTINELIEALHRVKAESNVDGTQTIIIADDCHTEVPIKKAMPWCVTVNGRSVITVALDIPGYVKRRDD